MMIDSSLLEILVCPICKSKLFYRKDAGELVCRFDRLAFPIEDDIPIMMEDRARQLNVDEKY